MEPKSLRYVRVEKVKSPGNKQERNKRILQFAQPIPQDKQLPSLACYWFVTTEVLEDIRYNGKLFAWKSQTEVEDSNGIGHSLYKVDFKAKERGAIGFEFKDGTIVQVECFPPLDLIFELPLAYQNIYSAGLPQRDYVAQQDSVEEKQIRLPSVQTYRIYCTRVQDVGTRLAEDLRLQRVVEISQLPPGNALTARAIYWFVTTEPVGMIIEDKNLFIWKECHTFTASDGVTYYLNQVDFHKNKRGTIRFRFPDETVDTIYCLPTQPNRNKRAKLSPTNNSAQNFFELEPQFNFEAVLDESQTATNYSAQPGGGMSPFISEFTRSAQQNNSPLFTKQQMYTISHNDTCSHSEEASEELTQADQNFFELEPQFNFEAVLDESQTATNYSAQPTPFNADYYDLINQFGSNIISPNSSISPSSSGEVMDVFYEVGVPQVQTSLQDQASPQTPSQVQPPPQVVPNAVMDYIFAVTPQTTLQIPFKQLDIGRQIGEGTYGVISEATWNGQMYAVKRFKFTSKKEDIIKETEVLQRLQHECIVSLKGVTTDPSTNETRLVLEYMADGSLDDLLSRDGAHLSRVDVIQIALDVAQGLHYLHSQKIIHRDLKSANVLLYNNKKRAKISDFGTVRIFFNSTNTTAMVGTLGFMAPEVLHGDPYDKKADVYSFGALLYNMLTRKNFPMLFKDAAAANVKIRSDVSDFDFQELILMCCKLEQNERPTIEACIEILNRLKEN